MCHPFLQALNDSGLGAAVIGGGIDDELKQPIFGLGLKGVDPANVEKVPLNRGVTVPCECAMVLFSDTPSHCAQLPYPTLLLTPY